MLGAPAVPLVETDDVEPGAPGLPGDAQHVVGVAAAFKPVHEDERPMSLPVRLPMAVTEGLGIRGDGEKTNLGRDALK